MTFRNLVSQLRERIRLPRSEDGSVAIEFAFIAPVLIIMYFGLFQISMVIMEDRRVSHSASVLGDLVTREATLDKDGVENVFQGATEVLGMGDAAKLESGIRMQIVSLRMEDDGSGGTTVNVIGSATINDSAMTEWPKICVTDIDPRLFNTQSGAVVARVGYNFKIASKASAGSEPLLTTQHVDYENDGINLQEQVIMKPRGPVDIPFVDPTATDPTQSLHFDDCSYDGDGAVSCSNVQNANNDFLTCN